MKLDLKFLKNMEKIMSTQNKISIKEVMLPLGKFPVLSEKSIFTEALEEMCNFKLGIACIVSQRGNLEAVITDGDIRRKLLNIQKPTSAFFIDFAIDHSIKKPHFIDENMEINDALNLMEKYEIWDMPVLNEEKKLIGLLPLHPVVKALMNH